MSGPVLQSGFLVILAHCAVVAVVAAVAWRCGGSGGGGIGDGIQKLISLQGNE